MQAEFPPAVRAPFVDKILGQLPKHDLHSNTEYLVDLGNSSEMELSAYLEQLKLNPEGPLIASYSHEEITRLCESKDPALSAERRKLLEQIDRLDDFGNRSADTRNQRIEDSG
jgi:hypothetical protein